MDTTRSIRWLSLDDLAERTGISRRTLATEWRPWGIPMVRLGKHLRIREDAFARWADEQTA